MKTPRCNVQSKNCGQPHVSKEEEYLRSEFVNLLGQENTFAEPSPAQAQRIMHRLEHKLGNLEQRGSRKRRYLEQRNTHLGATAITVVLLAVLVLSQIRSVDGFPGTRSEGMQNQRASVELSSLQLLEVTDGRVVVFRCMYPRNPNAPDDQPRYGEAHTFWHHDRVSSQGVRPGFQIATDAGWAPTDTLGDQGLTTASGNIMPRCYDDTSG